MDKENKINATFIIEILGRPKEHVSENLEKYVEDIGKEKGVQIIEKTLHEPKELEEKEGGKEVDKDKKLFTSFAEIESEFDNLNSLLSVVFKYMPSNIEINSPETFVFKNSYLSEILTGINLKLHKYDEVTKKLTHDNYVLSLKLNDIALKIKEHKEMKEKK